MDFLLVRNKSIVLISAKARPFLSIPAGHDHTIIESSDIGADIQGFIDNEKDTHILAVIFLHYDEYVDLNKLLSVLPFTEITYQFIIFGPEEAVKELNFENLREISEFRHEPISASEFSFMVRKTFSVLNELYINRSLQETYLAKLVDTKKDQEDLINMGRALSTEKDQDKLLRLFLFLSKRITGADAGSIFLVEEDEEGKKRLRFKYSHTFSRDIPLEEMVLPMDKKSISGYVAVTGAGPEHSRRVPASAGRALFLQPLL